MKQLFVHIVRPIWPRPLKLMQGAMLAPNTKPFKIVLLRCIPPLISRKREKVLCPRQKERKQNIQKLCRLLNHALLLQPIMEGCQQQLQLAIPSRKRQPRPYSSPSLRFLSGVCFSFSAFCRFSLRKMAFFVWNGMRAGGSFIALPLFPFSITAIEKPNKTTPRISQLSLKPTLQKEIVEGLQRL